MEDNDKVNLEIGFFSFLGGSLIGFMICALVFFGANFSSTGKDVQAKRIGKDIYSFHKGEEVYICELDKEKNTCTMHMAEQSKVTSFGSAGEAITFTCGKGINLNSELITSTTKPNSDEYDSVCEECFTNEQ